jgi:hypothetical protein
VSAVLVLVGLLVLSYAGTFLVGRRERTGAGLPSGVEYVVAGFLLGPHVLGVLGRGLVGTFEPLTQVAIGWLALLLGLDYGRGEGRRAGLGAMALGIFGGLLSGGAVFGAAWLVMTRLLHSPRDLAHVLTAGGIGAVGAETTRHVVRWVTERHAAQGRITRFLGDVARADAIVPLLAMAVLFSLDPVPIARLHVPLGAWIGGTIAFGAVLGVMSAMHIGRELRVDPTWGVLLGMSVLGLGVAARLGLSTLTVLFFMGWTTAGLSRHRAAIRAMVAPLERPILLPSLVLAGAYVDFRATPKLAVIVGAALLARAVAKGLFGAVLGLSLRASPSLGFGLLSSGAFSLAVGLAFAIRFPGPVGVTVLTAAFVLCVAGEIVGPLALKRALAAAGEIIEVAPPEPGERATDAPGERETSP